MKSIHSWAAPLQVPEAHSSLLIAHYQFEREANVLKTKLLLNVIVHQFMLAVVFM